MGAAIGRLYALSFCCLLLATEGSKNTEIARRLGIKRGMAATWRSRFAERRVEGLLDEPRPGAAQDDHRRGGGGDHHDTREPRRRTRRTGRPGRWGHEVGLPQSAALRIWRAFGLQPHRQEDLEAFQGSQFVAKVDNVVGLYLNPPERAVVLCVDEKSRARSKRSIAPPHPPDAARHTRASDSRLQALRDLEPVRGARDR